MSLRTDRRAALRACCAGCVALAGWPAWAREGVDVGPPSRFSGVVSAEQVEQTASRQYLGLLAQAGQERMLAPAHDPQLTRLRAIADRLIPWTYEWNARARSWRWEINLVGSGQINAFCMPGGKIAFFYGILKRLQLTDDEVAMVMGHEMTHALREHAREQMGKNLATRGAIAIGSAILGLGDIGRMAADAGGQMLSLRFGRSDESEADLVGLELAARAGYDPRASVTLWKKMATASKGRNLEFLSTHPSGPTRIADLERNIPKVLPLWQRASKPPIRYAPPAA